MFHVEQNYNSFTVKRNCFTWNVQITVTHPKQLPIKQKTAAYTIKPSSRTILQSKIKYDESTTLTQSRGKNEIKQFFTLERKFACNTKKENPTSDNNSIQDNWNTS